MAKRTLGLGNRAKSKKQKVEETQEQEEQEGQLTVELPEEVDPNDELGQLKGLYQSYLSDKSELILNGIIHECDRLLRNKKEGDEVLPALFYSIYGKSLNELSQFCENTREISDFISNGLERIDNGLEKYPKDADLLFAKAKIILNEILFTISTLKIDSENEPLSKRLDEALQIYEIAESRAKSEDLNEETLSIIQDFDDLLEVVDNFGKPQKEEEEEDENDEEEEEDEVEVKLAETHPLHTMKTDDKYNLWWREHTQTFLDNVKDENLIKQVNKLLGQSYLLEAEIPTNAFTSLAYDDEYAGIEELYGLKKEEARKISIDLINKALTYLKAAKDEEEPDSWADIAEAMIQLGNLYEVDSEEQEKLYKEAEEILKKANNVTNGLYEDILDNLKA
ncbi:unnamed protein product [Candida verbasci]|uniref:Enhancer of translation termination 1 n=1 Tax=Candida verbasci TaxID=1227364 RepID=A0A9W4TUT6_9ASCO|nr:unnamed protein product [Candida verbasci]